MAMVKEVRIQAAAVEDLYTEFATSGTRGIKFVGVWLVILLSDGVVDGHGAGTDRAPDSNANHALGWK